MIVIFDSLTGQSKRFSESLGFPTFNIKTYEVKVEDQIFLVTRSFNFGEISKEAKKFLDQYAQQVIGVAVSGNRNWGTNYGAAGDKIEAIYRIPLICKFEGSGMNHDKEIVKEWLNKREK